MSAIDIVAPQGSLIYYVQIVLDPLTLGKWHVEFNTEELRGLGAYEYHLPPEYQRRGVYGYVAFGYGGVANFDGSTNLPHWQEGRFINWERGIFFPPEREPTQNVRVWMRKGIKGNVIPSFSPATSFVWHGVAPPGP